MRIVKCLVFLACIAAVSATSFTSDVFAARTQFEWEDLYYISPDPNNCTDWTLVGSSTQSCDSVHPDEWGTLDGYLKITTTTDCRTGAITVQYYTKVCGGQLGTGWLPIPPYPCLALRMC